MTETFFDLLNSRLRSQLLRRFCSCNRAVVAIVFALMASPIIILVFGTIDYAHVIYHKKKIQAAMDAAIINATHANVPVDKLEEVFRASFEANIGDYADKLTSDPVLIREETSLNRRVNRLEYNDNLSSLFGLFFNRIIGDDEGWTIALKAKAEHSVKRLEISLLLDISTSMSGGRLDDMKRGVKRFIDQLLQTEDLQQLVRINLIPYGGGIRLPQEFDVFSIDSWGTSGGCLSLRHLDIIRELLNDDYLSGGHATLNPEFAPWRSLNPWCPTPATSVLIMENDPDRLKDRVDALEISAGTATDQALAWGLKFLSEKWQNNIPGISGSENDDKPALYDDEAVMKVLILFTDGIAIGQERPDNPDNFRFPDYIEATRAEDAYDNGRARYYVKRIMCPEIKQLGITLYTVGFSLGLESEDGQNRFSTLRNCATSPAHFYHAEAGEDISSTFSAIAAELRPLMLTE